MVFGLLLLIMQFTFLNTKVIACENKTASSKCVQIFVQNALGNAVSDVVVYLQPLAGQVLTASSDVVIVSQQDKSFSPYITVSQTNKKVNFVNQDNISHHIYSADKKNKFSFKIRSGTEHLSERFNDEAEIAMGCNIHDWMSGYLLVVDTPYFAKTDKNGHVNFSLVTLGKYRVVVWHPELSTANHRLSQDHHIMNDVVYHFIIKEEIDSAPVQESNEDFDFVSDY